MRNEAVPPLIMVSACLCGVACRYDGRDAAHPVALLLAARGQALPVCPEILGGLPVPRTPCELRGDHVVDARGADHTAAFMAGAEAVLRLCRALDIREALLKDRSPSCGCSLIYDGSFQGRLIPGQGVAAALLRRHGIITRPAE